MDTDKSWDAAQSACLADGGRLLTVNDLGTASLAARAGVGAWIGSNSRLEAGVFTNTDGSVLALDNWAEGMPGKHVADFYYLIDFGLVFTTRC